MLNVFSKVEVRSIVRFMRYGTRRVVFDFGSDREGARIENEPSCEEIMK